ncbi:glycosyltransferase 87 family protein [Streptomyces sp. NPDC060028]|uniref:glycosyltransferase 87 family protein n=1 Tax=Streptomyces sp. NPDC060028 TaxID=3347041 RepID=UPI00367A27D1
MHIHQANRVRRAWNSRFAWGSCWALSAVWAAAFPLISTLDTHRLWGSSAGVGYLGAAAVALWLPRPRAARAASVGLALTGAVVLPLVHLVLTGRAQSEVGVIERSGMLLIQQATPYLADPRAVIDYTPYLPGMALFGLPRVVFGGDGWLSLLLGDARVWCAAAFLGCLWGGRRILRGPTAELGADRRDFPYGLGVAALVASPVVALPLCVSGVDLPLIGLLCLGLAAAARRRPVAAGLALALACSLKWTGWPAIAVAVFLLAHGAGRRAARRCAGVSAAGAALLIVPSALLSPGAMVQQVLAFPTGRGDLPTPASSPLPGRLLADLGPGGWYVAVALLLAGGLAVAVSLVVRPPHDLVSAADRLALGLSVAFLLAPAGRFGYLALPVVLMVWPRLARGERDTRVPSARPPVHAFARGVPALAGGAR